MACAVQRSDNVALRERWVFTLNICVVLVFVFIFCFFFFQAEDGIRDVAVTGVQTCALPIFFAMHGFRVFAPNYRLAPENPFPAAVEDAAAVYRGLLSGERSQQGIVVAGEDRKSVV